MESKTKQCQNCNIKFTIEPEDFEFYKKIDVPEPTFCPECRMKRRLIWRNDINLYKRKCDFSGKEIFTIYHPNNGLKVYDLKIWNSDKWDPMEYGMDYDFNKPFFAQFKELISKMPWPNKFLDMDSVDCDYCPAIVFSKNCYLSVCNSCEDCSYVIAGSCNNCLDSYMIIKNENCYENIDCGNSYNLFFSWNSDNCIDSAFLENCRNCQNCFGCVNLRNKKYHIFNKPYSKMDYQKEIKKYDLGDYNIIKEIKKKFNKFKLEFPYKFANLHNCYDVSGHHLKDVKNCHYCFYSFSTEKNKGSGAVEDCKFIVFAGSNTKDSYDCSDLGTTAELIYEGVTVGLNTKQILFSVNISNSSYNIQYSNNCQSSSNLFCCIGLRHKQYCILNKQYSKKEYEELVSKIKRHMDEMPYKDNKGNIYKYGEFFPMEFSPFAYNESMNQDYFPVTKKESVECKYKWYNKFKTGYKSTIKSRDLPNHINEVNKNILKEVIECGNIHSGCNGSGVFKIIPSELRFYQKKKLALPRLCPDCRYRARVKQRNPLKLWKRQCMKEGCSNEFQTTYSPDRKEIIYCEKCYNREVG